MMFLLKEKSKPPRKPGQRKKYNLKGTLEEYYAARVHSSVASSPTGSKTRPINLDTQSMQGED